MVACSVLDSSPASSIRVEPMFALADGVQLLRSGNEYFVLSRLPLSLLRVNSAAFALLGRCNGSTALNTAAAGLDYQAAARVMSHLAKHGLVRLEGYTVPVFTPTVSVVVPVRNRARQIKECVESLLALDYPRGRLEIIVVDDGSEDGTPELLGSLPVRTILSPSQVRAAACRNLGWQAAKGEVIAFTDSDCRVDPSWLKDLVGVLADDDVAAVGGLVVSAETKSWIDRYEATQSPLFSGRMPKEIGADTSVSYLPTCNLLVKKRVLQEVGGFDTAFFPVGEDVDLVWRIVNAGYRVIYLPKGEVGHHHRSSLWPFAVRRTDYAASESQLLAKHAERKRSETLPLSYLLPIALLVLILLSGRLTVLPMAALAIPIQVMLTYRRLRGGADFVGWKVIVLAILRGYLGFTQRILRVISQYYLLPLTSLAVACAAAGWVTPLAVASVVAGTLVIAATFSYLMGRPSLGLPGFIVLFCIDRLAFQVGVVLGCIRYRTIRALLPRVRLVW